MTITNLESHITYRNQRTDKTVIENPKLLGLSAIEINPTELCNRTCSFCPRHDPNLYPNRNLHIDLDTVELIVEQLLDANYQGDINITGFGEPFLHPDILQVAKKFSKHFHTEIMTNGDRILKGKVSLEAIKKSDIHKLIVDCYDDEKQTNWFLENLEKKKIPFAIRNHYDTQELKLVEQYGFNNRGGVLYESKAKSNPCYLPSYKAFIDYNGDVRLCCNDWFRKHPSLGNVHETHFSNIWMSKQFTNTRKDLLGGKRKKFSPCDVCDVDGCKIGKQSAELWKSS